ncbi:tyrosine-protein kinase YwqD [Desulfosporosinus acididurans]|uniref:non-specific protein-tyrosine kinase n=1 Tax=Desulfosporosinus acididurans TaxID=476652 RepID=A0A0J1FRN0_9FIRM|nr:CpsD/CapB family tyrosine-protein kinase [Desulfosporosinus acididurans]KLU66134.1 tyrosine-protein kinase YwqD [Desulfosporosinus acididurans]
MTYSLITVEQAKSPVSEAFRTFRTNVQFTSVDSETKKIMITSAGPREGKSSTVANLAVSMAQTGKSVLIIDADLRNPTQHKLFGLDNSRGLSMALVQEYELDTFIQESSVPGIMVLTGGPIPPNPAELVGSKRMKRLIEEVSGQFDIILIDTPPIVAVTDAAILAQEVDGVILVVASAEVNRDYAQRAKEQLDKVGAKILGAVLNKADLKTSEYYYYYYYHGSEAPAKKRKRHKHEKKTTFFNLLHRNQKDVS